MKEITLLNLESKHNKIKDNRCFTLILSIKEKLITNSINRSLVCNEIEDSTFNKLLLEMRCTCRSIKYKAKHLKHLSNRV